MTTYDGGELRLALVLQLTQRWNEAATALEDQVRETLRESLRINIADGYSDTFLEMTRVARADETWVAAMIEAQATYLEVVATRISLDAQVASVLS